MIERESKGDPPDKCCYSDRFLRDYIAVLLKEREGQVVGISEGFFRLGPMMDWVGRQRDSIREGLVEFDETLIKRIEAHRAKYDADPLWLDTKFPAVPYSASHRATFTYLNLVRTLILELKGYRIKAGDGIDFCQAVVASSYSCAATLDKHWKRRVESLPKPNGLARIYYSQELDQMVDDIELTLARMSKP